MHYNFALEAKKYFYFY